MSTPETEAAAPTLEAAAEPTPTPASEGPIIGGPPDHNVDVSTIPPPPPEYVKQRTIVLTLYGHANQAPGLYRFTEMLAQPGPSGYRDASSESGAAKTLQDILCSPAPIT